MEILHLLSLLTALVGCLPDETITTPVDLAKELDVESIPAESLVPHSRKKRFIPRPNGKHGLRWDEIEMIVLMHNNYRGIVNPTSSNMRFLRWDLRLQQFAQTYAYQCNFAHQSYYAVERVDPEWPGGVGENLWAGSYYPNPRKPVFMFYDEYRWYNYTTMGCDRGKICGHYTQLVWADTYTVGCGMAECTGIADQDNAAIDNILVCNYGDGGNYVRERPYKEGTPCSACPRGYQGGCMDNLCMPTQLCGGITCENNGTLNTTTCLCHCPPGVLGAFCGGEIQATLDYLASLTTKAPEVTTTTPATTTVPETTPNPTTVPVTTPKPTTVPVTTTERTTVPGSTSGEPTRAMTTISSDNDGISITDQPLPGTTLGGLVTNERPVRETGSTPMTVDVTATVTDIDSKAVTTGHSIQTLFFGLCVVGWLTWRYG